MPTGTRTPPGPLSIEIGNILRAEMARRKMTQAALIRKMGNPQKRAQVGAMLNGTKPIDIEDLDRIIYTLDMDLKAVIRDADLATLDRFLS